MSSDKQTNRARKEHGMNDSTEYNGDYNAYIAQITNFRVNEIITVNEARDWLAAVDAHFAAAKEKAKAA